MHDVLMGAVKGDLAKLNGLNFLERSIEFGLVVILNVLFKVLFGLSDNLLELCQDIQSICDLRLDQLFALLQILDRGLVEVHIGDLRV